MDEKTLIERLSENPDVIAEMSRDELTEAKAELKTYGREQRDAAKNTELPTDERKSALEAASEARERIEAIDTRLSEFEAEDTELAEKADGLDFEDEEEPKAEEDETPEATEEPAEAEAPKAEETEEAEETPKAEEVDVVLEPEPVAASKKVSLSAMAKRAPKPPEPSKALVAAAAMPLKGDHPHGFRNPREIAVGALDVWNQYGQTSKVDFRQKVAQFDNSDEFTYDKLNGDELHDSVIIDGMLKDLRREAKTPEALTAAASFCSPAEPRYDYFGIAERAGQVQLPTLNASRGRITYRTSPSYNSVLNNAGWSAAAGQTYTSTNAEDGDSKTSFDAECPATTTCSVEAFPTDIRFTNFTDRFDPETVANVLENTMIFHDHYVNAQLIADMVTASTAAGAGDTGGGGLVNVANLVGFEAAKYRDMFRMSPSATLELVLPAWVHDALVADLVARNSTTSFENARARTAAVFASLNVRTQFVQDWQSIGDAGDDGWRTAADMLLFAPGTFVRLDGGTLDLGVVRDSTLNSTNEFSVFAEEFVAVCELGHDSWLIDDVTICPRGIAAADATLDCNPGFGS